MKSFVNQELGAIERKENVLFLTKRKEENALCLFNILRIQIAWTLSGTVTKAARSSMDSNAGSSVARRQLRSSPASPSSHRFPSLCFSFSSCYLASPRVFFVGLEFFSSFVVASCNRSCRYHLYILWLLFSIFSSLMMSQVPDLTLMTCNFLPLVKSSQISDLLMLRHTLLSSSLKMINFLPLGKIYPVRFWWECGSWTSPPCPILVGTISLNGSEHYYQTILARNLLFEDPVTNLCSPQTPLVAAPSDDYSLLLTTAHPFEAC